MPNIDYEIDFIFALVQTITIETFVLYGMLRYLYKSPIPTQEILFVGIICSFATLPYVWFVFPIIHMMGSYQLYIWSAEVTITLIEMVMVYKILKVGFKEAFVLATVANLASYLVGYFFLT